MSRDSCAHHPSPNENACRQLLCDDTAAGLYADQHYRQRQPRQQIRIVAMSPARKMISADCPRASTATIQHTCSSQSLSITAGNSAAFLSRLRSLHAA